MSISHPKDLGSASSSSPPLQNSNTNHGFYSLPPQHHPTPQPTPNSSRQLPQPPPSPIETQFIQSVQFTDSFGNTSETLAPDAETTGGSSKKVNKSSESGSKKLVAHQHNVRSVQHGTGTARCREKHTDFVVSPCIQQSSSWPTSSQASTTHGVGRKTQMINGNHLLNFHYDHRISRPQSRAAPPPRRHHKRKPYNKDLFLQANYKFVLLDSGHNAAETMDPDKMLMWEDIVCMKFTTPIPVQCPICLDDPLCPQITSCGHIFCFPCILRYFLSSDYDHQGEIWKKCPLCFVMISSKDLHTIYIENVKQLSVGDTAEFVLLTRQKDSFLLSLKNKKSIGAMKETPDLFSKFSFTSDVDLSVRHAISELDRWLTRADSGLVDDLEKLPYVCAAMEQLQQRRKYWDERRIFLENVDNKCNGMQPEAWGSPPTENYVKTHSEPCQFVEGPLSGIDNIRFESVGRFSDKVVGDASLDQNVDLFEPAEDEEGALSSLREEGKGMQRNCNGTRGRNEKDSYDFYQAIDGQHLILHPLNLKCLLHHYGSYDMLPHRISGKILQLETVTQSEVMRRRYRFLSHFPLTTTFQLCEIDLGGLLPPDALALFMDEIKNRELQRKRLAKKERQEKIKAEAAATAELANHVAATMAYHNTAERPQDINPTFSMDDFEALGGDSPSVVAASSPPVNIKMHFANVARLGFAAGHDSPALRLYGSTPSKPTNPEAANVADVSGAVGGTLRKNSETPSFANVITRTKAVQAHEEPATKTGEIAAKKGKKPTKVLLSTGGGRRY